jgi:hypothetical protein
MSSDRNVYILGAGFSADARLPMMLTFLGAARNAAVWLREERRRREARAVDRLLAFREEATRATFRSRINIDNVEELFSLASATGDRRLEHDLTLGIAAVIDHAASVEDRLCCFIHPPPGWDVPSSWGQSPFSQGGRHSRLASVYDHYLAVLAGIGPDGESRHEDVVITFNYDLLLEEALRTLRIPFNYGFRRSALDFRPSAAWISRQYRRTGLTLLKLHGSMNWAGPLESAAFADIPPRETIPGLSRVALYPGQLSVYGSYSELQGDSSRPMLVPPTWRKTFGSLLAPVWEYALRALATATRIVVVGYSAPATDQHFHYLLAAGLMHNDALESVWFVKPSPGDPELRGRVQAMFHRGPARAGVGTMLKMVPKLTSEFFFSQAQLSRIGRGDAGFDAKLRLGPA